jgi:polysaccharide export outer membrane protein
MMRCLHTHTAASSELNIIRLGSILIFFAIGGCQSIKRDLPDVSSMLPNAAQAMPEYRIQPGDILETHYLLDPNLNEQIAVGPDGRINLSYVPDVMAAGLTIPELRKRLDETGKIISKSFALTLRSSVGTRVYVVGEVNNPGEIVANGQISALQAISRGGGYKLSAQSGEAVLVRRDAANVPQPYTIDLDAAADGTAPREDVLLQPYDILYVPRDRAGNVSLVFERIRNAIPTNWSFYYGTSLAPF